MSRRLLRPFARLAAPAALRRLALVALAGLWLIVPSGALVRLTASGLGCPKWPLECEEGRILPELSGHQLIEFTNRVFSALVMGACVLLWLAARAAADWPRALRRWSGAAALATVGQIPLGGVTVAFDLHPLLVSSHFLLSMVALGCGTMAAVHAHDRARGTVRGHAPGQGLLATATALTLLAGLVTGVLVTAAGPHSGDRAVNRRLWNVPDAAYVHVRVVFAFAALALALAAWVWFGRAQPRPRGALVGSWLALVAVQIALGEWQYRHQFPWRVVLAHVTVAGLLWALTVALAVAIARPRPALAASAAPVGHGLAGDAALGVRTDA